MVSHICLLVKLVPICNSMAISLCLKSCEDHSLGIMEVYGKTITGLGPKEENQARFVGYLRCCACDLYYFFMHCFGFSKSFNDFSFKKSTCLKQKLSRLQ